VPPDSVVPNCGVLVLSTRLPQSPHAVCSVVLQLGVLSAYGEGPAGAAEARQREVVVEGQHSLGVVEALDVRARLGVVPGALYVLEHVHVRGDSFVVRGSRAGLVEEVDVADVVRGSRFLLWGYSF